MPTSCWTWVLLAATIESGSRTLHSRSSPAIFEPEQAEAGRKTKCALRMPVVIAFVSQKGGVGKSTLARALAVAAARAGWIVKLVDLDPTLGRRDVGTMSCLQ